MNKASITLAVIIILAVICIGGYFGSKYYFSTNNAPEYFYEHPTIAKIFGISPVCPTICTGGGICGRDGKNYCNQCDAFKHGAGYAYDGPCKPVGWNTYDNFGISFQYPNSKAWGLPHETILNNSPQILFADDNSFFVSIVNYSDISNGPATFEQEIKNYTSSKNINYSVSDITLNGVVGKEILFNSDTSAGSNSSGKLVESSNFIAMFPINNKSYVSLSVSQNNLGQNSNVVSKNTFDTLISTFKLEDSTQIKTDPANGNYVYNNGDIAFEYPATFGTTYASLNMQTILARPGDSRINLRGCYVAMNGGGKASAEKISTINNIKFCMTTGSDAGAGQLYNSYYYTALHNGYYYVLGYAVHVPNGCSNYTGTPNYQPCLDAQKNYNNVVVKPIQNSISTFKFIK